MATLRLVRFDDGDYALQGSGDPSAHADFSLFALDGSGGDPFVYGNCEWAIVGSVAGSNYDADDSDSFWWAWSEVLEAAHNNGVDLPDYSVD